MNEDLASESEWAAPEMRKLRLRLGWGGPQGGWVSPMQRVPGFLGVLPHTGALTAMKFLCQHRGVV